MGAPHRLTNDEHWAAIRAGRLVVLLTRVTATYGGHTNRTLHFTFDGGSRSSRSRCSFVKAEHVPDFEGDTAWFEMEKVKAKPWPYWRALRQVELPGNA